MPVHHQLCPLESRATQINSPLHFSTVQYYLPDEAVINKDFLKDVLVGKKQLLRKHEVNYVHVPHYDELSVRNIYPMFRKDPEFQKYFPEKYPVGKGPPRTYTFNILATLYPEYLKECMDHASEQGMAVSGVAVQSQSIQIS